jgi:hypothetical protein
MLGKVHKVLTSDPFLEGVAHSRGGVRMIKRIIRSLTVTALVVLALAVPAFAQEDLDCHNRNGDDTIRCGEDLYTLNTADDYYNEDPPWDYTQGYGDPWDYGNPWDYGDESDDTPPWDYGYPALGDDDECYDEDACEEVQDAWEEYREAVEELYG